MSARGPRRGRGRLARRGDGLQLTPPLPPPPLPPPANEKPVKGKNDYSHLDYKCLVRATDGKRKLTTTLTARELPKFKDSYATILKVWPAGAEEE